MLAFHNDLKVKQKYLKRLQRHEAADEIVHGYYWQNGKGCAVGCTVHGYEHSAFETELGIPMALARLEDRIFEGLKSGDAKTFPRRFLEAVPVGVDLSKVSWRFLYWLLTEELSGRNHPLVCGAVKQCADSIAPLTKGESAAESAARSAARSAACAAWSAAESAARSAARSAASAARSAASAASAARSAARSAASAARSAAWSAAESAASAAAWSAAESAACAAESAAYQRMANKLIELLAAA